MVDDDDKLSIKKKPGDYRILLIALAILVVVVLLLFTCLAGLAVVGAFAANADSTAAKLPGSWKGEFHLPNRQLNVTYTFNKDGTFREETFDMFGGRINLSEGRWQLRNDEVEITWNRGGFEIGSVHWVNRDTMDYRIVDHTQPEQIGLGATFRRQ